MISFSLLAQMFHLVEYDITVVAYSEKGVFDKATIQLVVN